MVNAYTPAWFEVFLRTYWPEQTARELAFLEDALPLLSFREVLDLCCGAGRHALPLAARGYRVVGIDRDEGMLARARREAGMLVLDAGGSARFVEGDMREVAVVAPGPFDAVICMWQSFGYFDAETNAEVLRQMCDVLSPGGRLILDLYNRDAFAEGSESETAERAGRRITTTRTMAGNRLAVSIDYGDDVPRDTFAWQLYAPSEIAVLGEALGLRALIVCAGFDAAVAPSRAETRMQVVFERGAELAASL